MKIVIVGGGKVGEALCAELNSSDNDIIIVDTNQDTLDRLIKKYDVAAVVGNGANYTLMQEIGMTSVDMFVAVTDQDEINMVAAILAGKLGATYTVARVRNPEYSTNMSEFRDNLGISLLINPELASARYIARILKYPSALSVDQFANGRVNLVEVEVDEGSILIDLPLSQFRHVFGNVIVCAIFREGEAIIPKGEHSLRLNDRVYLTGTVEDLGKFYRKVGKGEKEIKSALIIGGGKISHYLLEQLKSTKIQTTLIEVKEQKATEMSWKFPETEVIVADGTDQEILDEYQIEDFDSFISLTGIDEENLIMSVYARHKGVKKVITKMSRPSILKIIKDLSIKSIITPKQLVTNDILQFVRSRQNAEGSNVEAIYRIVDNNAEALQFKIKRGSGVVNVPLYQMRLKPNLIIAYIIRGNQFIFPNGNDVLLPHDRVIVVTTNKHFNDIDDILAK